MLTRRQWLLVAVPGLTAGCIAGSGDRLPDRVWGQHGLANGRFDRPRAIAIDQQDRVYVVDKTARIQVFTVEGQFHRGWRTPETKAGQPCGLGIDGDGNLLVADTHYFRVLIYTPEGRLLKNRVLGGRQGNGPGQFNFVTDAIQDPAGNYYIAEYGLFDRIQKFSRDGRFVGQWGEHGSQPGQFIQPRALALDPHGQLWVADACNHRLQVFDVARQPPRLVSVWGEPGTGPGQLRYPYGLALDSQGHVYVSEFGNSRVQKFTAAGRSLACWGSPGRNPGQLNQPWSVALDSRGRLFVLDTYNHRIQRIRL